MKSAEKMSAAVGAIFGMWFIGLAKLSPWNYEWLYSKGDGALTQLSFEYFRNSPIAQWPLTAVPKYIEGSKMILPTENAVANLLGKVLGQFFDGNFQIVGIWIVFCFALQAFFGAKLLKLFITTNTTVVLGSLFFLLSPALLYRIGAMNHYHLGAHWMILLAMCLYFDTGTRTKSWSFLLAFAMLTSVYIAAMLLVLFAAQQLKMLFTTSTIRIRDITFPIVAAGFAFWVMGYLSMRSSITGLNFFRLNAFAYINPGFSATESYSLLINLFAPNRLRNLLSEEWESFQYLGTVVLFGAVLGSFVMIRKIRLIEWRVYAPIAVAVSLLFMFALSNQVFLFQVKLTYWWPNQLLDFRQVFRGATRFGWPAYYALMLFAIVQFANLSIKSRKPWLFSLLVVLMAVESSSGLLSTRNQMRNSNEYVSSLNNPTWKRIVGQNKQIAIYPNFDLQIGQLSQVSDEWENRWFDIAKFASDNGMATNFGYAPRPLTTYIFEQDEQILRELQEGNLRKNVIYIVSSKSLWERVIVKHLNSVTPFDLDGLYVLISKN
jgi:hypothetical protein